MDARTVNPGALRQPDIFERSQAQASELVVLSGKIADACWKYEAARVRKDRGAMEGALKMLQTFRAQFNNMIASAQRVVDGGI
jgi:hypothetical protein